MATGSRPDPQKRRTPFIHSSYLEVGNGKKEAGYIAGPIHGCYGHHHGAHKPCLFLVTEGELQCPYCSPSNDPIWRGYVPVWDRNWTLRHVLIGEEYFPSVEMIPHRAQVTLHRHKNPISPLVIEQQVSLTRELPDRSPWSAEVNTLAICLTLWKIHSLSEWYKANPHKLAAAEETEKRAKLSAEEKDRRPLERLAAAQQKADREAEEQKARILRTAQSVFKPAPNGNGAYKGPPKG